MKNESSYNDNHIVLQGRIYPAIQRCVGNRYYILIGIFGYYGFILNTNLITRPIHTYVSIIFTLIVSHNIINYCLNAVEQRQLESKLKLVYQKYFRIKFGEIAFNFIGKFPNFLEFFFATLTLILIWGGWLLLDP